MTDDWYTNHTNLVILTRWMVEKDYDAEDVADAVAKPWKYEPEFRAAVKAAG